MAYRPWILTVLFWLLLLPAPLSMAGLWAGAAKVDITNMEAGPVNDLLYAKALVIRNDVTTVVIATVDAVAIGEIGPIPNDYLRKVRSTLESDLGIPPTHILINASHCHGIVAPDVADRTVHAIKKAVANMVPVTVGVGVGHEDRIMENRRLKLKSGKEVDVRHAYSMPSDDEVAEVGPIDPEIGVLRLNQSDGATVAVVYNFAMHPIQGVPTGGNTADVTGFASQVIEDNLDEGAIALFLQGCAGDINPILYKDVDHPRDAEPLGSMLGLSTLKAIRRIQTAADERLRLHNETIALPRGEVAGRIVELQKERDRLVKTLTGTTLSLKTFIPLVVKHGLSSEYPSYYSHRYLHDKTLGRAPFPNLDRENRQNMERYARNVYTMEELTRLQTNLALLEKHHSNLMASGKATIDVELVGLRVGDFVLTSFPGELTVRIGLGIKERSPHEHTFVAGYTNGYIYYAPTAEQLRNVGGAQEDSDCLLAPEWQALYETKVAEILENL